MKQLPVIEARKVDEGVRLCSEFDEDCFDMSADQHQICSKSLPIVFGDDVYEFYPKDGHCPFEMESPS